MGHDHAHHGDASSYFTEQLFNIAVCAALGGVMVAMYFSGTRLSDIAFSGPTVSGNGMLTFLFGNNEVQHEARAHGRGRAARGSPYSRSLRLVCRGQQSRPPLTLTTTATAGTATTTAAMSITIITNTTRLYSSASSSSVASLPLAASGTATNSHDHDHAQDHGHNHDHGHGHDHDHDHGHDGHDHGCALALHIVAAAGGLVLPSHSQCRHRV